MVEVAFPLPVAPYRPRDCVFKIARTRAERAGFFRLRREIFCEEQGIFHGTDEDEVDRSMIPIVAVSLVMGMEDEVIGVVRIDEREPGVWWGSRLGVRRDFRRLGGFSRGVRARYPFHAVGSVGAGLICKAVSTARALGCREFFAFVQEQNVPLFERLGWRPLESLDLHGRRHAKMQADLARYPPAERDVAPCAAGAGR